MTQPSFLTRKTFGSPNYFWIAMGFALIVAMIPFAARDALHSNTNKAEDWLPKTYSESTDLQWFRQHFISEGFVLVTWDGCTLGNTEKLSLLEKKLEEKRQDVEPGVVDGLRAKVTGPRTGKWFRKIITGPSMIEELTQPPLSLSYGEAVKRLEKALVSPAQLGADGRPDDSTRVTCLVAYMSPEGYEDNRAMRRVVQYIRDVAIEECGVPQPQLHMGGPTVDNVAIDTAGEGSLARLALLSGIVGLSISFWCFRNFRLTGIVVAVGAISAALSLAIVSYFGFLELLFGGPDARHFGRMDAVLMSMPAVVYVLGLTGAIHLVNYYRDARIKFGQSGAVERAVRIAWAPCALAALTTAVGLGSLVVSDIVPIKKFGGFTAVAVLATLAVLFSLLPVYLHRFPPRWIGRRPWDEMTDHDAGLPPWAAAFARWITGHYAIVTTVMLISMFVIGLGALRMQSSIRLLKLLDDESDLVQDYTWIEGHMGYLVPMEVVLTVPPEKCRSGDQHTELEGGQPLHQYRMTMLERLSMVRHILKRVESLGEVSRVLSTATLAPEESRSSGNSQVGEDYATNNNLEDSRERFRDYLQWETDDQGNKSGRELWRISARVTALQDIDYGQFTEKLRDQVEPVLLAYRQRDELVRTLQEAGGKLEGARVAVLFRGQPNDGMPSEDSQERLIYDLLKSSDGIRGRVTNDVENAMPRNLTQLQNPDLTAEQRAGAMDDLRGWDAVLVVSDGLRSDAKSLAAEGVKVVDLTNPDAHNASAALLLDAGAEPRPVRSVYTGIIPLVFKTQRQLLVSLKESIAGATVLIAIVMAIVFRSAPAGLVAMLPNLFPIMVVFGALGWVGIKIDIGIMMTASVALGVAVDNTVHMVTWFRRGQALGLDRRAATLMAYERCATAMVQAAMVGGLGLVVFSFSQFTPTKQFGYLMITILSAALVGDLVMLPALLCGPLGSFFERRPTVRGQQAGMPLTPTADDLERDPALALAADLAGTAADVVVPDHVDEAPKRTATSRTILAPPTAPADDPSNADRTDDGQKTPQPAHRAAEGEPLHAPMHSALRDKLRSFRRT